MENSQSQDHPNKLTIMFSEDQMTSVLWDKEKDTVVQELVNRLCTLRGLDPALFKARDEFGKKIDTSKTVGELNLVFVTLDEKGKKKKKTEVADDTPKGKLKKGAPPTVKNIMGKYCDLPLEDQLFDNEKKALAEFKEASEFAKYYSDEFLVSCLFSRKLDIKRSCELLAANFQWRKENGFLELPKLSDVNTELFAGFFTVPGARTKEGCGVMYSSMQDRFPGVEPFTIKNVTVWAAWYYYIGIFHQGYAIYIEVL
eukprot:TRINITY_DN1179_c0_g1_i1.p1 TRINITY_DN1179_c0_g1~~TRINITY_DN1179_c0_g1_i1.p1  ORF type:complete len:256 (-),score=50.70 TRINITY_DN1179_c0_g1_i1:87-854(-)